MVWCWQCCWPIPRWLPTGSGWLMYRALCTSSYACPEWRHQVFWWRRRSRDLRNLYHPRRRSFRTKWAVAFKTNFSLCNRAVVLTNTNLIESISIHNINSHKKPLWLLVAEKTAIAIVRSTVSQCIILAPSQAYYIHNRPIILRVALRNHLLYVYCNYWPAHGLVLMWYWLMPVLYI